MPASCYNFRIAMAHKTDQQTLEDLKTEALSLMEKAGFPVTVAVDVEIKEDLKFMGYTTHREGKPVIVVAGFAIKSGGALNLLVHELSHVYMSEIRHPSHDYHLLTSMSAFVMHGRAISDYREQIINNVLNIIQDLYADDISFKIFSETTHQKHLNEFFMSWIHEPVKVKSEDDKWVNAEYLLDAAFASANLKRHNVPDTDGKVKKAVSEFLAKLDKSYASKFDFFEKFMILLPEQVEAKEFEKILIAYLSEFAKLTK